jgi:heme/copper-type cytochrome/quinol oxidase subunit 3
VSLPDSRSTEPAGVLVRKPKSNVYTALLGIALAAIMLGCLFLVLEITEYGALWSRPWVAR